MTRIMGTCMGMGEAAGTAAALSIEQSIIPAELDVQVLRRRLLENGAILSI